MELIVNLPENADPVCALGAEDRNLKLIREALGVRISARDGAVRLQGDRRSVSAARRVLDRLGIEAQRRRHLSRREVLEVIANVGAEEPRGLELVGADGPAALWKERLDVYVAGCAIEGRTPNQKRYLEAIRDQDLVFAIGPAGVGKTYLAVAAAVHLLKSGRVRRLVLVRPAVEAGEKLGFLPGDLEAKVNPYLRPLFDALHDMMDIATIRRFAASDVVEIAPLAYMRGRTLNDAVIILDEAQNTTRGQMKMLLTRMGERSKVIVTGDVTQIDLPDPRESGLVDAARRLRRVKGVSFITLEKTDIVRHDLVQRIVDAYTTGDDAEASNKVGSDPSSDAD